MGIDQFSFIDPCTWPDRYLPIIGAILSNFGLIVVGGATSIQIGSMPIGGTTASPNAPGLVVLCALYFAVHRHEAAVVS